MVGDYIGLSHFHSGTISTQGDLNILRRFFPFSSLASLSRGLTQNMSIHTYLILKNDTSCSKDQLNIHYTSLLYISGLCISKFKKQKILEISELFFVFFLGEK